LEFPRELPGLLLSLFPRFYFFCVPEGRRFANILCAIGILFIGFYSPSFPVMLIWLFIFSIGQHLFLPLNQSIGMELATEGRKAEG